MTHHEPTAPFAKASGARQKKIDTVNALSEKISKSRSIIFTDYTGIKHKQLETLRKNLKKTGAEFIVTKNKLLERSLRQSSGQALGDDIVSSVKPYLKENTGTLFNYEDEVAGLKELLKYFKTIALGKTKGGLLGKTALSDEEVTRLSKLPGKQELLGKLAGQLKSPLYGLHYALSWNMNKLVWGLNAVKGKKTN